MICCGAIKRECHSVYCSPCAANNAHSCSFCLLTYLVRIHPLSSSALNGDVLPLYMVLKQTQYQLCSYPLVALENSHPRALTTIDPVLKLYPFQVTAFGRNPSLSATYYLLRNDRHELKSYHPLPLDNRFSNKVLSKQQLKI